MKRDYPANGESRINLVALSVHQIMIDESCVACVQTDHPLQHALLILIKSGYSAVPVLDSTNHVVGTISKTLILDLILGLERIEFERLDNYVVLDAMNTEVPRILETASFLQVLQMLIAAPFICVEAADSSFSGIVTRSIVLSKLHRFIKAELRASGLVGDASREGRDQGPRP